jgi:hypothetical protein
VEAQALAGGVVDTEDVADPGRPHPPRRAVLRDLLEEVAAGVEEEGDAREDAGRGDAAVDESPGDGLAVGEGERELERGVGAGLAVVVAADAHRVPPRHVRQRELGEVALQAEGARRGECLGGDGDRRLHEEVVLAGARERAGRDPLPLRGREEHREVDDRSDGLGGDQRDAGALEGDPGEEVVEILADVDGDPAAADVRLGAGVVGVDGAQTRVVEDAVDPGGAALEEGAVAQVGVGGGPEAGELADCPGPVAVHPRTDAPGEREGPRGADPPLPAGAEQLGTGDRRDGNARGGGDLVLHRAPVYRCE